MPFSKVRVVIESSTTRIVARADVRGRRESSNVEPAPSFRRHSRRHARALRAPRGRGRAPAHRRAAPPCRRSGPGSAPKSGAGRTRSGRTSCRRSTESARRPPARTQHHGGQRAGIGRSGDRAEDWARSVTGWLVAASPVAEPQDRAAHRHRQRVPPEAQQALDGVARQGVGASGGLDEQQAAPGRRQRQAEDQGGSGRRARLQAHAAHELAGRVRRHREAVAPSRQGIDRLRGGEARLEDEAQERLGIGRRLRGEEARAPGPRPRSGRDPGPARRRTP